MNVWPAFISQKIIYNLLVRFGMLHTKRISCITNRTEINDIYILIVVNYRFVGYSRQYSDNNSITMP
jgi:hypothetical protein